MDGWTTAPPRIKERRLTRGTRTLPDLASASAIREQGAALRSPPHQIWHRPGRSASGAVLSDRRASARWGAAHVGGRPAPEQPQSDPRSGRRFGDPRAGRCSQIASAPDLAPTWAIREQGSALRSSGPLPDGAGPRSKGAAPEQSQSSSRAVAEQPQSSLREAPEQPQSSPRASPEQPQSSPRAAPQRPQSRPRADPEQQ